MKTKILFFSLLIIAFLTSCQKDGIELTQDQKCSNILYFENDEEMFKELGHILSLNLDEKILWQKEKGFSSKGITADKFYDDIDPESFKSKDEIVQFVENNSNLLLIEEQDGEYSVETIFENNPFRYFMNEDHIFQVGEKYYKVFSNLRVGTSISNIEKLKEMNDKNHESFIHEKDLDFCYLHDPSLKSASDCWNGITDRKYSEKIKLGSKTYRTWLKIYQMLYSINNNSVVAINHAGGCQVLNIFWWSHKTTLYFSTNSVLEYTVKNFGLQRFLEDRPYESAYLESEFTRKSYVIVAYGDVDFDAQPHLINYDYAVWSDAGVASEPDANGNYAGLVTTSCN